MEVKFWAPSLTTQFAVCPVPFHLDTYRGCFFNCNYCFARDFVTFHRRKTGKPFTYLVANNSEKFSSWLSGALHNEYDYTKGETVAIKERIPLKIGATSDPCPPIEATQKTTLSFLKELHAYNYPVEIQTKNPVILASHAKEFKNPNWTVAVTLITMDKIFSRICEPNAPLPSNRLRAITALAEQNIPVMVKIQPAIYPKILTDLPALIKSIADAGCWAFNIEGLKIRISMPIEEQVLMQKIGSYLGTNLRDMYRKEHRTGSDWELREYKKIEYIELARSLAYEYRLKFYVADNDLGHLGDDSECCGTKKLRDYKIWGNNIRTKAFASLPYESIELGKCIVNFTRADNHRLTLAQCSARILESKSQLALTGIK